MEKINEKLWNWASILDVATGVQATETAEMPFVYPHVALMPDAHLGKGATVGSVIPTERAIIPAAVGVDIGCGMIAVRTQLTEEQFREHAQRPEWPLSVLRQDIERDIPLSAGNANVRLTTSAITRLAQLEAGANKAGFDPAMSLSNWQYQLGTLGSGNHFIEVTADEQGSVWLFLHSGSRGVGNKIAQHHIKIASDLCQKWYIPLPNKDLAYLVEGTDEFWAYMRQMQWAQEFARLNREEMMDRLVLCVERYMSETVQRIETVNCHHNFTRHELHYGRELWVSRKGAIRAGRGEKGLIPGSMGTASYVVSGLGNVVSLCSAPHGAGRQLSRGAAKRAFDLDSLRTAMKGIEFRDSEVFLDEHPEAYKPIDQVMQDATNLVTIEHTLHQLVNVKGD